MHCHPLWFAEILLHDEFTTDQGIDPPPRLYVPPTKTYPWHTMVLRDIFTREADKSINPNRLLELQLFAPQEVRKENRMIMSDSTPQFHVTLTENDKRIVKRMYEDLLVIAKKLGHFIEKGEPAQTPFGFTHPIGICRMGKDPRTSVADTQSRVHGFENLYLATVGLIPITIAVNPTLTAAALAVDAMEKLA